MYIAWVLSFLGLLFGISLEKETRFSGERERDMLSMLYSHLTLCLFKCQSESFEHCQAECTQSY